MNELPQLVREGSERRWGERLPAEVSARLESELEQIRQCGLADRFLDAAKVCAHAREIGALAEAGRGAAPSSAVLYALGVTEVDPLKYDLLFERFVTPESPGCGYPRIMLDFDSGKRAEVYGWTELALGQEPAKYMMGLWQEVPEVCEELHGRLLQARQSLALAGEDLSAWYALPVDPRLVLARAISKAEAKCAETDTADQVTDKSPDLHPLATDLLAETNGRVLFQEQVMAIAMAIAGFSRGQARRLLKTVTCWMTEERDTKWRHLFIAGCLANERFTGGMEEEKAAAIAADLFVAISGSWRIWMKSHFVAEATDDIRFEWLESGETKC